MFGQVEEKGEVLPKYQCDSPKIEGQPKGMKSPTYFVAICPHLVYNGHQVSGYGRDEVDARRGLRWVLEQLDGVLKEAGEVVEAG